MVRVEDLGLWHRKSLLFLVVGPAQEPLGTCANSSWLPVVGSAKSALCTWSGMNCGEEAGRLSRCPLTGKPPCWQSKALTPSLLHSPPKHQVAFLFPQQRDWEWGQWLRGEGPHWFWLGPGSCYVDLEECKETPKVCGGRNAEPQLHCKTTRGGSQCSLLFPGMLIHLQVWNWAPTTCQSLRIHYF